MNKISTTICWETPDKISAMGRAVCGTNNAPAFDCDFGGAANHSVAQTSAAERSNMPPNFYPAPSCEKPDKKRIGGAPGVQDQNAMRAYNYKIKVFNDKAAAFNACIKAYVDGAQNDINTVQTIVHAAVAAANAQ